MHVYIIIYMYYIHVYTHTHTYYPQKYVHTYPYLPTYILYLYLHTHTPHIHAYCTHTHTHILSHMFCIHIQYVHAIYTMYITDTYMYTLTIIAVSNEPATT